MWITSEGSLPTTGYLSSSFTNPPAMMPSTADTVCERKRALNNQLSYDK